MKKALLIGINYYGTDCTLRGCQEDIINVQDYLELKGYTEFTILKDSRWDRFHMKRDAPTRKHIVDAMRDFISKAKSGNTLWIHYSGHGTQLPCKRGQMEKDGMDECICPVDFGPNQYDEGFIRDNDLNAILVAGLPQGVKLRVCFDSCHSGSALDLPYMWTTGLKTIRESKIEVDRDVIFISGCKDNQTSADAMFNGKAKGAMTWSLLESLAELPKDHNVSWEDLVERMRKNLKSRNYKQIPQLSIENPSQLKNIIDI